jgi:hypothetical protein
MQQMAINMMSNEILKRRIWCVERSSSALALWCVNDPILVIKDEI